MIELGESKIRHDAKACGLYKLVVDKTQYLRSLVEVIEPQVRTKVSLPNRIYYFAGRHRAAHGGTSNKRYFAVIANWAFRNPQNGRLMWTIYHELSHVAQRFNDGFISNHDERFYHYFKQICPKQYWHYERAYMPRPTKKWLPNE